MTEADTQPPNMPIHVAIHEALRLADWAVQDRAALEGTGMDWQLCEDLTTRSAALRHAEALWANERFINEEAQAQWKKKSVQAYDLRDTMVHTFRFAFRKRLDLGRLVDQIAQGNTHVDMLQDLKDLAVAGRRNEELLTAVNFDLSKLDQCENLAEELGRIYAEARNDRQSYRQAKLIRDKIFTLLKQSVDEVRAYGQYVFWRDAQRRSGYSSEYFRVRNRPSETPLPSETAPEQQPEQQP